MKKIHTIEQLTEWMKNEIAGKKQERKGIAKKLGDKIDQLTNKLDVIKKKEK